MATIIPYINQTGTPPFISGFHLRHFLSDPITAIFNEYIDAAQMLKTGRRNYDGREIKEGTGRLLSVWKKIYGDDVKSYVNESSIDPTWCLDDSERREELIALVSSTAREYEIKLPIRSLPAPQKTAKPVSALPPPDISQPRRPIAVVERYLHDKLSPVEDTYIDAMLAFKNGKMRKGYALLERTDRMLNRKDVRLFAAEKLEDKLRYNALLEGIQRQRKHQAPVQPSFLPIPTPGKSADFTTDVEANS